MVNRLLFVRSTPGKAAIFSSIFLTLSACGGGNGGIGDVTVPDDPIPDPPVITPTDPPVSDPTADPILTRISDEIDQLESIGLVPELDRSNTLTGTDNNGNGVRDDIDNFIDTLDITDQERLAVAEVAVAFQQTLSVDTNDESELQEVALTNLDAMNCLLMKSPDNWSDLVDVIESVTANTEARVTQYINYNVALTGSVSRLPSGDTCNSSNG